MLIHTEHELYIIQLDFTKMISTANPSASAPSNIAKNSRKLTAESDNIAAINCDIIGYINTTNYSPNFNDNTSTEICDALWLDQDKFITSGNKHLSVWRIIETSGVSSYAQHNNIDIMRQKFKFGKYKNKNRNINTTNERPMSARIADNNIQFATSPSLRKITFKLGTFTNSCFMSIAVGDIEKTKDTLYVITTQGILCTFNIKGRYLQKWVNLRMDKAYYIAVKSSIVICCGAPDKTRVFDSDSLKHLGTFPTSKKHETMSNVSNISVCSSIATVHAAGDKQSILQPIQSRTSGDDINLRSVVDASFVYICIRIDHVYIGLYRVF